MIDRTQQITTLLEPIVTAMGFVLWGCEYLPQGRLGVLRVYIDGPKGVALSDCEKVSRQVSAVLDVEDPISRRYSLEVSSPGIDRPLFSLEQYRQFQAQQVKLRLRSAVDGRKQLCGILTAVSADTLTVDEDGESFAVPFASVQKGYLSQSDQFAKKIVKRTAKKVKKAINEDEG